MNTIDFEKSFPNLPPEILAIASALQNLILRLFPAAFVTSDQDNAGYGFGSGYKGLVFTITPYRKHVNLGIAQGASLDDPHGLLEGTGKVHRHVKLDKIEQVTDTALEELMRRAIKIAYKK